MQDNETPQLSKAEKKEKIRAKYRGLCADGIEFIPARVQRNIFEDDTHKRVGIYARVSTDSTNQVSSFELQKSHYEDLVKQHPNWELIEIYADEGISGTDAEMREQFMRMIQDCKAGKMDLIVVKSVSRFARNIVDCLKYVRALSDLRPPIGVYFEIERIFTLNDNSEMGLKFSATIAEEESRQKSRLLKDAYVKRSRYGIVWTPSLLGYDLDDNDNLVINEDEAKTVRLIFFMYLYGYTCAQIAETLTSLGRVTGKGNTTWAAGSVLQILQNERHCGDILTQKSWTPNFLTHKVIKNRGDLPQYRKKDHHEPIISRDDFIAVQHLIANAKYGNRGILPKLKVIMDGALQGFVSLNPRWAAFRAEDYRAAAASVYDGEEPPTERPVEIKAQSGDFDLRGFEVARSQFFNTPRRLCVTFSMENLWFSSECVRKFNNVLYVEILINPLEHLLAVRPCSKDYRNAVKWAKIEVDKYNGRMIVGTAFLKTLYEMFGWDTDCKYRIRGVRRQKGNESILIFDMRETEIFIPTDAIKPSGSAEAIKSKPVLTNARNSVTAFPQTWSDNFGQEYYRQLQARELAAIDTDGKWDISEEGKPYHDGSLNTTEERILADGIKEMISDMERGDTND